jgi:hypothetical protein
MRNERGARSGKKESVSKDLEKRLEGYALAAAAGLGVLALAMPAEATIIGSSENIVVDLSHPNETLAITGGPTLNFHLNDFEPRSPAYFISVQGAGIGIPSPNDGLTNALRIPHGAMFGPNQRSIQFGPRPGTLIDSFQWQGQVHLAGFQRIDGYGDSFRTLIAHHQGYLGFEWNGHVGWAELQITGSPGAHLAAHITEYAYDTVPGQSITVGAAAAGEPSTPTLVLLALGALGLAALRKRKRSAASRQEADAVSR